MVKGNQKVAKSFYVTAIKKVMHITSLDAHVE